MHVEYEEELRLALVEGVLSREEADSLRAEALRLERSPLELLVARGRISEETLVLLRGESRRESAPSPGAQPQEPSTLGPGKGGPSPNPAPREQAFPVPDWDRYQPVRFLGQGGMGQVFLAYDPRLRRNVALKFVRDGNAELARRFVSEARAQARVSHERVCKVYEVGEVQGHPFIAMQYVDGQPLGQLAPALTLEQKLLVMREVAEGVHAAHRAGLIHRDIKPSNILVERTEDGRLEPYVMDFGLARDWQEEATATGSVLGTPHYMAPEQARGEVTQLDRRADVYSLGATLYSVLTGQPPSPGSNALEVISRIQSEEPRPPRALQPDIPVDLEAIVLKCLEKERSARYDSARALAEDLERFLGGEPVRARPAGLWYRLRKKARKHRLAVSLGTTALLVVTLALAQAGLARGEVAERERLSRRYTERVERIEAMARYSGLAPLHDASADRQEIRARMEALEAEVREAGERAEGPGNYAVGRALLALGDMRGAHERLDAAWELGFREPHVAYVLALVMGYFYEENLLEVERIASAELREARRRDIERRYRDPALTWLRQAAGAEVPSPPQYVAALLTFYEGRYEQALEHLAALSGTQPWFHEAPLLRGDILLARGSRRWNQGDRAGALADLEASRQALAEAASIGRSVPDVYYAQGRLEYAALVMELYGQGDVLSHYTRGLEALSHALAIVPDHYESKVMEARFHRRLAELRTNQGDEAQALLDKALAAARTALRVDPHRPHAPLELAQGLRQWARYLQERGQDPREQLGQAIEAFERVGPEGRDAPFHTNLGLTFKVWADYEEQVGADSLEHRSRSIDAYVAALGLDAQHVEGWINLGIAYFKRASHPRGSDPDGDLEKARDALARAQSLSPGNYVACFYGAQVHEKRARRQRNRGGEYEPDLRQAFTFYRQALSINSRLPQLHNGLGGALLWQAQQLWEDGGNPEPLLDEAQAAFEQARAVAPRQGFAHGNLGEVSSYRARYQLERGENPSPSLRLAVEAYQQALAYTSNHAKLWANLARAHHLQATWLLEHGQDPNPALAQALEALRRGMELNSSHEDVWRYLGETRALRARWLAEQGRARSEDFEEAAQAFQRALELEPGQLEFRLASGHLYREWAAWQKQAGGDPTPLLERGLGLAEEVLSTRPRLPQAHLLRASVLQALAESSADPQQQQAWRSRALEDLEQALAHNPNLEPAWRGQLTSLRRLLARSP